MSSSDYLYVENEIGLYLHAIREAKGYTIEEVCNGICSVSTLFRIELGERVVDYIMIEALLDRMKVSKTEYEFVLDEEDCQEYMQREEIKTLIMQKEYTLAEKKIAAYEKNHGEKVLHRQFLSMQKGYLKQKTHPEEKEKIRELFLDAISITAPEYETIFENRGILSNIELNCLIELVDCMENGTEKLERQRFLYDFFQHCRKREKLFPIPYRSFMEDYAECLYENGCYAECIEICNEALEELFQTSKVENRAEIFLLRAKAKEKIGFHTEEERELCLQDFLTAYYVMEFYDGEESVTELKKHIQEEYKEWQFIE